MSVSIGKLPSKCFPEQSFDTDRIDGNTELMLRLLEQYGAQTTSALQNIACTGGVTRVDVLLALENAEEQGLVRRDRLDDGQYRWGRVIHRDKVRTVEDE